ncbi:MAG: MauE/DoxX family redox-associated membrane protein [Streptomyces sp.]|uniref:MauE/DoxX family redox-associated membrane protein n=1 Tax=Streptomyces sp. TaxID=1931 RepID=UPI003D6B0331
MCWGARERPKWFVSSLLLRPRSRTAAPAWIFAAVALVWAGLAAQAYARGLDVGNCGCFGRYLTQPLRWFVLVEDALMLLYAAVLLRQTRGLRGRLPRGHRVSGVPSSHEQNRHHGEER